MILPELNLSIIIVSFNTRDYLKNCLDSIYQSSGMDGNQVIVVDNCSTDGSPEMVESTFPQVILLKPGVNLGFARANNLGATSADGRYLLFLNPDTIVFPDTFHKMVEFMDSTPKAGAANCLVLNQDGTIQLLATRKKPSTCILFMESLGLNRRFPHNYFYRRYVMSDWDRAEPHRVEVISGAFFMIKSDLFNSLGGFNAKYFLYVEDVELSERIWESGNEIWFNPSTRIIHYGGKASSKHALLATVKGYTAIYSYLYSYKGKYLAKFYKLLLITSYFIVSMLYKLLSIFIDRHALYNNAIHFRTILRSVFLLGES